RAVRLAGALVAVGSLGIAAVAGSLVVFAALLAVTALGNAVLTPSISHLGTGRLRPGRRGTWFGLQQSGPPLASVLAGLALPTLGAALGWRWVFAIGAAVVLAATAIVGEDARGGDDERPAPARPSSPTSETADRPPAGTPPAAILGAVLA